MLHASAAYRISSSHRFPRLEGNHNESTHLLSGYISFQDILCQLPDAQHDCHQLTALLPAQLCPPPTYTWIQFLIFLYDRSNCAPQLRCLQSHFNADRDKAYRVEGVICQAMLIVWVRLIRLPKHYILDFALATGHPYMGMQLALP